MRRPTLPAVLGACAVALVLFLLWTQHLVQNSEQALTTLLASPSASSTIASSTKAVATPPPAPQMPEGNLTVSANAIRNALVNIICYSGNKRISSISGSGVIVDPKGIILTNAHIGEYFLLSNEGVSCTIRTGDPARDAYTASLIFISPAWLTANVNILTEASPTGTGEHDIALLAVTGAASSAPALPATFPYVPIEHTAPLANESVVIGSYAAQFLNSNQIASSLAPTIVDGTIKALYTFTSSTIDVISLGGSAAAQEGSSGGGVVDAADELTGLVTTSTTVGTTASRDLAGITATYIRRDIQAETGQSLDALLAEPLPTSLSSFAPHTSALESVITADLPQ